MGLKEVLVNMYIDKRTYELLREFYNLYGELDYDTESQFRDEFHKFIKENDVHLDDEEKTIKAFIKGMPFKSWEY